MSVALSGMVVWCYLWLDLIYHFVYIPNNARDHYCHKIPGIVLVDSESLKANLALVQLLS